MSTVALAHDRGTATVTARFHYDPEAVAAVREVAGRRWDPDRRLWTVPVYSARDLVDVFEDLGYRVTWTTQPPWWTPPKTAPAVDGDLFGALFQVVPDELRPSVYRHLALALHPDHGGSDELMKRLNSAYDAHGRAPPGRAR